MPAGSTTAITGPTGSGKSTLLNLLLRGDDPESGRITLGGTDLCDLATADRLGRFAILHQDPTPLRRDDRRQHPRRRPARRHRRTCHGHRQRPRLHPDHRHPPRPRTVAPRPDRPPRRRPRHRAGTGTDPDPLTAFRRRLAGHHRRRRQGETFREGRAREPESPGPDHLHRAAARTVPAPAGSGPGMAPRGQTCGRTAVRLYGNGVTTCWVDGV
ncbi:ATP-binding cassette domain-containing protein [Streptomyces sp. NPDC057963]|uniref:ATP-binding cassette domain-containing protein n=1 Tax=Streptomyces sp. NPDC057963 TaxID=3346290 RepID=UPI0036E7ECD7